MYSEQPRVTCREVTKLIINYHKHPSMPIMSQYVKVGLEYKSLDICTCDIFCIQCRINSVSSARIKFNGLVIYWHDVESDKLP